MGRLKQQHSQNYTSSGNINTEFENIVRYLNVAELGNKTVGELMDIMFDVNGNFDGPVELRLDSTNGFQYRVGTFDDAEEGWITIAATSALKGDAGQSVGTIEGPFFFNRQEFTATASQTVFAYTFDSTTDDLAVYVNGLLQFKTGVYTSDSSASTVTFGTGLSVNDLVTIYSIRTQSVTNYLRSDLTAVASQAVFPFVHGIDDKLIVFRNGILQQEGGGNDYTASFSSDTITFTSALTVNDLVTIITVENLAIQNVAGMMFEDEYTDAKGKIVFSKLSIADGDIPQLKVASLATTLAEKPKMTIASVTPTSPTTSDLWLDTSQTPNLLKFYDGTQFLQTSPDSTLPAFTVANANYYVRVNGTGTALEYGTIDNSTLVPKTYLGAANGVASLNSSGKMPSNQLPDVFSTDSLSSFTAGTVSNGDVFIKRIWKEKIRIDGIAHVLSAGTCTIQLKVDGVVVGTTHSTSSSLTDTTLGTTIEIDATSQSKLIEIVVTSVSSAADLEVGIAIATISV